MSKRDHVERPVPYRLIIVFSLLAAVVLVSGIEDYRRYGEQYHGEVLAVTALLLFLLATGAALIWRDQRARLFKQRYLAEREKVWLRGLLATSLDELYVFDPHTWRFTFANRGAQEAVGYSEAELLDMTPLDLTKYTKEAFSDLVRPLIGQEKELVVFDGVHRRKDGSEYSISVHLQLIESPEGRAFFATVRDITKRMKAEEALRQERNDWQSIFGSISDAITIHDGNYNIIRANKAAERMLGSQFLEKALGGKCYMFYHGTQSPPAGCPSCQCLTSGVEGSFDLFEPHLGKHLEIRAIPRLDNENRLSGLIHVVRDITERKRSEEALKESEERFRSLYENSTIGLYRTSPEGRILMANRTLTEMLGYASFDELAARDLNDNSSFEPSYPRKAFIEVIEKDGVIRGWESAWTRKDGTLLFVRESVRAVRDASGKTLFYDGTVEDITERKRAEEQIISLSRFYKTLSEVNQVIVHEPDRATLLGETCQILVDHGGFKMAWIGFKDEATGRVVAEASSGFEQGYLDEIVIRWDDSPEGRGPTGRAIREKRPVIFDDCLKEPDFAPWRGAALARGYRTSCGFPITEGDAVTGALMVYGTEPGAIGHEEARLLEELAGDIGFALHAMHERNQHERAENALQESEERYRDLVENASDLICTHTLDGILLSVNAAAARAAGFDAGDLVGHNLRDLLPREQREGFDAYLQAIKLNKEAAGIMRIVNRAGKVRFWEYRNTLRTEGVPTPLVRGVARDVTEAVLARRALKASEETFRSFFDNNPAASYVHTGGGQLLECNQAFCDLFGFASKEEALRANLADRYVQPEDRAGFLEELAREKRIALREATYKRVDGSPVHVIETVTGIFDKADRLTGAIGFLIDVTERKSLEGQLRQSQKMEALGQLAGGVAHDFNNILMAMKGAGELLGRSVAPDQPGHKEVVTIQRSVDRAATLTRQLLGFARKTVLEPVPLDPNELVDGLLPMVNRLLPETIRTEFIRAKSAGYVNADKGQIEQVLMNLCVNARDAMPNGGTLTIETENVLVNGAYIETHPWAKSGRYVLISVTDTGAGMRPDVLAKVFDPFFTTKPEGKGTGLGLSMAYGIVKQHDGMINVYSELGVGTTFKLYLPMVERRATVVGTKVTGAVTGGHETILLVEDDKEVRDVVVEVLMSLGYKVLSASDGAEGLEVLRQIKGVELVVTDIIMPKMGGKELRQATRLVNPSLRFLFTSGYTENVVHHDFVLDKGVSFLSKPYGIDVLARKVRDILDRKGEEGG